MEERVGMVRLYCKFENAAEVQRQWRHHFDTDPPVRETILATYQKFLDTRVYSAKYRTIDELKVRIREACATVTPEMCQRVCDSVSQRCQACIDRAGHQLLA